MILLCAKTRESKKEIKIEMVKKFNKRKNYYYHNLKIDIFKNHILE